MPTVLHKSRGREYQIVLDRDSGGNRTVTFDEIGAKQKVGIVNYAANPGTLTLPDGLDAGFEIELSNRGANPLTPQFVAEDLPSISIPTLGRALIKKSDGDNSGSDWTVVYIDNTDVVLTPTIDAVTGWGVLRTNQPHVAARPAETTDCHIAVQVTNATAGAQVQISLGAPVNRNYTVGLTGNIASLTIPGGELTGVDTVTATATLGAASAQAVLTSPVSPVSGSSLDSDGTQTFTVVAHPDVTARGLRLGSTQGGTEYDASGALDQRTSFDLGGYPGTAVPVWMQLTERIGSDNFLTHMLYVSHNTGTTGTTHTTFPAAAAVGDGLDITFSPQGTPDTGGITFTESQESGPAAADTSGNDGRLLVPSLPSAGTYSYRIEAAYDSRIDSLRYHEYNIGWGRDAITNGPYNEVTVQNFNELRNEINSGSNKLIRLHSSLAGISLLQTGGLVPNGPLIIDGRDAPGCKIVLQSGGPLISLTLLNNHVFVYGIFFDGDNVSNRTAVRVRSGQNYCLMNCSFRQYTDDTITSGEGGSTNSGIRASYILCKTENGSRGFALDNDTQSQHDAGRHGYITSFLSDWSGSDRLPRNSGGTHVDYLYSRSRDWSSGGCDVWNNGAGNTGTKNVGDRYSGLAWMYVEGGIFRDPTGGNQRAMRAISGNDNDGEGPCALYHDDNHIYGGGALPPQGSRETGSTNPIGEIVVGLPPAYGGSMPYPVPSMTAAQAETIINTQAGAENMDTSTTAVEVLSGTFPVT